MVSGGNGWCFMREGGVLMMKNICVEGNAGICW